MGMACANTTLHINIEIWSTVHIIFLCHKIPRFHFFKQDSFLPGHRTKTGGQIWPLAAGHPLTSGWSRASHCNVHMNYLGVLLKCRFWFSRCRVDLGSCISCKFKWCCWFEENKGMGNVPAQPLGDPKWCFDYRSCCSLKKCSFKSLDTSGSQCFLYSLHPYPGFLFLLSHLLSQEHKRLESKDFVPLFATVIRQSCTWQVFRNICWRNEWMTQVVLVGLPSCASPLRLCHSITT